MTDINTTLRGKQKKKEDPKKPSVILKKIIHGLTSIILAVVIFTVSSWQLPVIFETVNCMYKNNPDKTCPYPSNENAPPYSSKKGKYDMDPFQAFLNIVMSTLSGGLIGLSRGVKCCKKKDRPIYRGGGSGFASELTKFNLQIGDKAWKPFDINSNDIGWPYDAVKTELPFGFNYWLGSSQIKSWSIPRQITQGIFLFLANLMNTEIGEDISWFMKFIITLFLPVIFILMLTFAGVVSLMATIWGGFLQHIINGNLAGCVWGFFCTWALIIFNMFIQPAELLGSLFIIPALTNGSSWVKTNWKSTKNGGYREIILGSAFIAFIGVVLNAFSPILNK
jgi:hypothetical protein